MTAMIESVHAVVMYFTTLVLQSEERGEEDKERKEQLIQMIVNSPILSV
jgi:hypothetical protein